MINDEIITCISCGKLRKRSDICASKNPYVTALKSTSLLLFFALGLISCHKGLYPAKLAHAGYRIKADDLRDTTMLALIAPYRDSVDKSMNEVVGTALATLQKKQPTGSLGNFMADAVKTMAIKQFNTPVEIAIINYGGIRSPELAKGAVTRGRVFELMPFDNLMVLQKLTGAQVQQLFDHLAERGGWPIAGATFVISNKKAVDILVGGRPLQPDQTYTLANSDYVANGGDDAAFLKPIPQINSGYLIRDALITYIRQLHQEGKAITENNENRIRHAE